MLQPQESLPRLAPSAVAFAQERLISGEDFREQASLNLLAGLGMNTVQCGECDNEAMSLALAESLGYPVALKTAADNIFHKSDVHGVLLNLSNASAVSQAYRQLSNLGPRVLVTEMVAQGVELAFGMVNDSQFGPIVMVGAGGSLVEVANDKIFALPPFGPLTAKRLLEELAIAPMYAGVRAMAPIDVDQLADALSRYSMICYEVGDLVAEMDLNPIIASSAQCIVVDALVSLDSTLTT